METAHPRNVGLLAWLAGVALVATKFDATWREGFAGKNANEEFVLPPYVTMVGGGNRKKSQRDGNSTTGRATTHGERR